MKKRTAVYSAEEKALKVMLEGEQEEERRRERERHAKKERDKQLQRKHRVDSMLFGGKTAPLHYTAPSCKHSMFGESIYWIYDVGIV